MAGNPPPHYSTSRVSTLIQDVRHPTGNPFSGYGQLLVPGERIDPSIENTLTAESGRLVFCSPFASSRAPLLALAFHGHDSFVDVPREPYILGHKMRSETHFYLSPADLVGLIMFLQNMLAAHYHAQRMADTHT
jgi:hypothetical protein